jgi:hypothetical protein
MRSVGGCIPGLAAKLFARMCVSSGTFLLSGHGGNEDFDMNSEQRTKSHTLLALKAFPHVPHKHTPAKKRVPENTEKRWGTRMLCLLFERVLNPCLLT